MKLFTFDHSHNPGRSSGWTIAGEAVALCNAGMSGLAGMILANGYSQRPADAVYFIRNDDKLTLAEVCAAVLVGIDSRKSEGGGVKPVINGTPAELFRRRLADIADKKAAGIIIDGRRRCIASILAYGCGRDDMNMEGTELTPEQANDKEGAFKDNYNRELAARLDPWAKVEAGLRVLADKPTLSEAELMAVLGVKRGDGQLIHRAATAIRMHGLTPDVTGRCPGKEEWSNLLPDPKGARPTPTGEEAKTQLAALVTGTRDKAVGVDSVVKGLEVLPEGTTIDARKLASVLKTGKRADLDAYFVSLVK